MIILLGAPGSGKGTQSDRLSQSYNLPYVCMGDIVRNEIKTKTILGKKMISFIDKGDLVPDSLINDIFISNYPVLSDISDAILDGYPRTLNQAKYLSSLLENSSIDLYIFLIDVPDQTLTERLLSRSRSDDTLDVITNRLETYHREIKPILEYYGNRVLKLDGNCEVDVVFSEISNHLKIST